MQRIQWTMWTVIFMGLVAFLGFLPEQAAAQVCSAAGLAPPCINQGDISNNAVRTGHIRNNHVRTQDIQNEGITADDLATDSVGTAEIATGAVGSAEVADNSLTASDLATDSVGALEIADNSIDGGEIINNSLSAIELSNEAGADFASGNQLLILTAANAVARSVVITAPTAGFVIVNASGYFDFNNTVGTGRCAITTGATVDFSHLIIAEGDASTNFMPFSATRGFVVAAGSTTFNLVCNEFAGNVEVGDSSLTAIYVPTRY